MPRPPVSFHFTVEGPRPPMFHPILVGMLTTTAVFHSAFLAGERADETVESLAGEYAYDTGLPRHTFYLTPEGQFSFAWYKTLGQNTVTGVGARLEEGHLLLRPGGAKVPAADPKPSRDLVPVRWGDRLYLVRAEDGPKFCNTVNLYAGLLTSARFGAYLRDGDEGKRVVGLPAVPKSWEPMLLKKRLVAKVIERPEGGRLRVDFGGEDGVWKGMNVWVNPWGPAGALLFGLRVATVVEVAPTTCVIDIKNLDGISASDPDLKVFSSLPLHLDD